MYKKDSMRVEDGIVPMLLESLILSQIAHKDSYKKRFKGYLEAIQQDIKAEMNGNKSVTKRLLRVDKKVNKYFVDNGWCTRKSAMVVSYLAAEVARQGAVKIGDNTLIILFILNRWIRISSCNDVYGNDVEALDISAAKQVPKVLKIIQSEGYF